MIESYRVLGKLRRVAVPILGLGRGRRGRVLQESNTQAFREHGERVVCRMPAVCNVIRTFLSVVSLPLSRALVTVSSAGGDCSDQIQEI
jgi:hypothetical protein